MKLLDHLNRLPEPERLMLIGRLQGMTLAMRIARNRAEDCKQRHVEANATRSGASFATEAHEAETVAAMIRLVQVSIGNGTSEFPALSVEELDEINRIY